MRSIIIIIIISIIHIIKIRSWVLLGSMIGIIIDTTIINTSITITHIISSIIIISFTIDATNITRNI